MTTSARRVRVLGAAGAVLLIAGAVFVFVAWRNQQHPPQPPASAGKAVSVQAATPGVASPDASRSAAPHAATRGPLMPRSIPVHLTVPAIGVSSRIQVLGLARDGSVQVPPLGADSHAGWYKYSPTPGQLGPSIILGHIDSAKYGPGVFFRLGALRQREKILITRADGSVATFEIERVVEYQKRHFPTLQVYGNLDHAGLRLITCGGRFDPQAHSYEDNIVVYASLTSFRRGPARP